MLPINRRSLVLAALVGSAALPAFSETIFQLKNGDRVTGKIVSEDTNQVVIATTWVKEMALPLSQISRREEVPSPATNAAPATVTNATVAAASTDAPAVALGTNSPALKATNAPVASAGTNAPAASKTNAVAGVAAPIKPKAPKRWNFDLQAGVALQYNQKSYENFSGLAKADYNNPELLRNLFEYHGAYGRTEGVVAVNRMDIANRTEHDIGKTRRAFVFNAFGIGYDAIRDIDLMYDDSLGLGYKLYQRPTFALALDFGANYQRQYFAPTENNSNNRRADRSTEFFSLRVGEQMTWAINKRVSFEEKGEFYPHMDRVGAYRFRLEGNVNIKLNEPGTIYLVFAAVDLYDTHPPKAITRNDLQINARVGMKF